MPKRMALRIAVAVLLILMVAGAAIADGPIRTYLTFRVTTRTQSAVANVGEDLQIEVGVEGTEPTAWQWYFEGEPIAEDADQRIYNIVNAQPEDAGIYTLQAYRDGKMVLKVDVNVRVIDTSFIPASGDNSMPVSIAYIALGCAGIALIVLLYRKRASA